MGAQGRVAADTGGAYSRDVTEPSTFRSDLVRPLLDEMWRDFTAVEQTASTNDDLLAAAAAGAPEGTVRLAELQTAGRGRLDRRWDAPAGTAIMFSVVLRPSVSVTRFGWLPLLVGLAVYDVLVAHGGEVALKWPNDVQLGPQRRKCAGILLQMAAGSSPAVVVGMGLNAKTHAGLPETGIAIDSVWDAPREEVFVAMINALAARYRTFIAADGDVVASGLLADYRAACRTVGERVRVFLPGRDEPVEGDAIDVDAEGRLIVDTGSGAPLIVGAGDVVHVRPSTAP